MATEKWVAGAGVGLTWTDAFTSTQLNTTGLAADAGMIATNAVSNNTALDLFCDISFTLASDTFAVLTPRLEFFLLPLNKDGTTYGDGTSSNFNYLVAECGIPQATVAPVGTYCGIIIPPGTFKFAMVNRLGRNFITGGSSNSVQYRTYNLQVVP